jgi:hypothetical protein
MTSELEDWWLVVYQDDENNRWALFNTKPSAVYFYNRLGGARPYRFIQAVAPVEVARRLSILTA